MVHKRKPMPGGLKGSPPHWILRELRARIHWALEVLELCNQFATKIVEVKRLGRRAWLECRGP